jgi:hypothetical protein
MWRRREMNECARHNDPPRGARALAALSRPPRRLEAREMPSVKRFRYVSLSDLPLGATLVNWSLVEAATS